MNKTGLIALGVCLTTTGVAAIAPAASATTTTKTTTAKTVTKQVSPGTTLNVRTGPGTSYATVGTLGGGAKVTGTLSGSWFKITSGSYAGRYVSSTYLIAPAPSLKTFDDAGVVATKDQKVGYVMADASSNGSSVNVRSAPSFSASVVGTYGAHGRVVGTPQADGVWWKVGGGYVHSAVLTTATANPSTINAKIPTSQLCKINSAFYSKNGTDIGYGYTESTPRYFQCKALPALNALEAAYKKKFGAYAGIDNAYRTWAEQDYWFKLYHPLGIAVSAPGQSNHGYGLAVDFQASYKKHPFSMFTASGTGRAWVVANGLKYGFDDIGSFDAPHFNFVG